MVFVSLGVIFFRLVISLCSRDCGPDRSGSSKNKGRCFHQDPQYRVGRFDFLLRQVVGFLVPFWIGNVYEVRFLSTELPVFVVTSPTCSVDSN